MEIKENYITFKTACLAKEKDFEIDRENCKSLYNNKGEHIIHNNITEKLYPNEYEVPTQTILQEWLRLKHDIIVWWEYKIELDKYFYWIVSNKIPDEDETDEEIYFNSPHEALEEGLYEALMYVKN